MDSVNSCLPYGLKKEENLESGDYDAVVFVSSTKLGSDAQLQPVKAALDRARKLDSAIQEHVSVLEVKLPSCRLIYSPVGKLSREYHDVRSFAEATCSGIKRALGAGAKVPLLVLPDHEWFPSCELASLLGAMEAVYVSLQLREEVPSKSTKLTQLGVWSWNKDNLDNVLKLATALEIGRGVARDIGATDPERMCPVRVQEYVEEIFRKTEVKLEVISDPDVLAKEYPLFTAVDRASRAVERYKGRIIYMTYEPEGTVRETLFLVGKGVTYDSGGADIKINGNMMGMSRDKCGAAAVAGFMKVVAILRPEGIKIVGAMPVVRNNIGPECYVADEIISARTKTRVLVINSDAEGRMILADVLCRMKELAVGSPNPHLVTIATLTGHAERSVGKGYTIAMDNGPARAEQTAQKLQERGERLGDMFEISTIRREDFRNYKGLSRVPAGILQGNMEGVDLLQLDDNPATKLSRGHQGAGTFLILASGLHKHGLGTGHPLKYTHLDIAPSAATSAGDGTGSPLVGLYAHFIQKQ